MTGRLLLLTMPQKARKQNGKFFVVPNGNIDSVCNSVENTFPDEVPDDVRSDMNLALDELLQNIKQHAHDGKDSEVIIDWELITDTETGNKSIQLQVLDPTPVKEPPKFAPPSKEEIIDMNKSGEPRGRGLFMINKLVDRYQANNRGLTTNYILEKQL
jgi:anti-sigma regulatory factor (Ser/Thr protein kinase)